MPFGLTNAPPTFQRLMDLVLAGLHWKCCFVYLDYIIFFTEMVEDYIKRLREVFQCIRNAGLTLKRSKWQLFRQGVTFLGHKVSAEGIGPDPSNIDKVTSFPVPRDITQLQNFLGLANYYRKFIRDFANIAEPLNHLMDKDVKFILTPMEFLWLCSVAAPKSLPAHPFNALIFPILRGCVQSFVIFLSLNSIPS